MFIIKWFFKYTIVILLKNLMLEAKQKGFADRQLVRMFKTLEKQSL